MRAISYAWANTRISTARNVVAASADIFKKTLAQLELQLAEAEEQKLAAATLIAPKAEKFVEGVTREKATLNTPLPQPP